MALAPRRDLFSVPSSSISTRSMCACSETSRPRIASQISVFTWSTAFCTPLPKKRCGSPSRSSIASREPVEAPDGTAARPMAPDSTSTSASTVGLPRESRISRATTSTMAVILEFFDEDLAELPSVVHVALVHRSGPHLQNEPGAALARVQLPLLAAPERRIGAVDQQRLGLVEHAGFVERLLRIRFGLAEAEFGARAHGLAFLEPAVGADGNDLGPLRRQLRLRIDGLRGGRGPRRPPLFLPRPP